MRERITPQSSMNEIHIKVAAKVARLRQHYPSRMYFPNIAEIDTETRGKLAMKKHRIISRKIL